MPLRGSAANKARSSEKEHREDALPLGAEEGRGKLRKAMGSGKQALIHGCPNGVRMGKPGGGNAPSPIDEHIVYEEGTR